ncbi:MAG: hypothetical protein IKQ10_03480 [Oscillospiraceae bacterium]|nr:hypothetical protein [Oscillospiraceae bacterium]
MGEKKWPAVKAFLVKNSALVVLLCVGVGLLLIPTSAETAPAAGGCTEAELRLSGALSRMEGVGEAYVLLAEKPGRGEGYAGAVVVCPGASDPGVRLRIVETVGAFTGLGSNHIVVQKMIS